MAIQFPNFLSVPVQARDYSGMGDAVENFYKGYNMPKDALIKEIQAKFAQPNAEADLKSTQLKNVNQSILNQYLPSREQQAILSSRLGNRKSQMELDQELELERQMRAAMGGKMPSGMSGGMGLPSVPMAPSPIASNAMPSGGMSTMPNQPGMPQLPPGIRTLPGMPQGLPMPPGVGGMTMVGSPPPVVQNGAASPIAPSAPSADANAPSMPNAAPMAQTAAAEQPEDLHEVVVAKGAPQLAGIDAMYDSNPLSRAFLEKKGFKKSQEVKFDNKTGRTTIITKYPSGKVTTQISANTASGADSGFPLTNKMISKHQNIISSIDNAIPRIEKILDEGKGFQPYPRTFGMGLVPGFMSQSSKYDAQVKSALDSLMGAYGLPSTDKGLETVHAQIQIGHGETIPAYKRRLKELVQDLKRRKAYSENEVKRSNKIQPIDTTASGAGAGSEEPTFSSDEWEQT